MIIQTLSRAAVDRSTTCRFSYDKCFDISNTKIPSLTCPFPSIFIRISQSLANSLSTHRPPPFQVALGPSSSFQQKLHFYQIVINYYGKFKDLRSYRSGKGRSVPAALYSHDSTKYLSSSNHNSSQSSSWTRSTPKCLSCRCLFGFVKEGYGSTTPLSDMVAFDSMSS